MPWKTKSSSLSPKADLEGAVERVLKQGEEASMPAGALVGVAVEVEDACEMYMDHVVNSIQAQGIDFSGLRGA